MHKTFISYHHRLDQDLKDEITTIGVDGGEFIDKSVMEGDINTTLPEENIMRKIRENFIQDSTVVLVIVGEETAIRPYINSEIQAALWGNNPTGLICVVRDELYDRIYNENTCDIEGCRCGKPLLVQTDEFKKKIPYLINENHSVLEHGVSTFPHFENSDAYCSIYPYSTFKNNMEQIIDEAYDKRSKNYNLKKKNGRGIKTITNPYGF